MNKIELLAPAKDLAKAKIAVDYGADAVYIGGKSFSLRSRASNFDIEDIKEIVNYAHNKGVKIYVTVNMVFHDEDFVGIKDYLNDLESIGVDGIIISSVWLLELAKLFVPNMEKHMSTQLSTVNSDAVNYLKEKGADRVVLGRECSMEEIKNICLNTDAPIEVFIHGGMCSNYSGRCTLSNRMTNRDANRGGCAHSCRWKYRVYENNELISDEDTLFSMSSKDLRATNYIEEMIRAGVASLKIEGRMKSDYYIAQVVKTYRKMIDEIYEVGHLSEERIDYYDKELNKAENRPSDDGFLSGNCDNSKHLYGINGAGVTHDYVALVKNYDPIRGIALIEVKNYFKLDDELEVFGPDNDNKTFIAKTMFDVEWNKVEIASKPTELLYMRLPFKVYKNDMIRKIHNED
ncbi:MAG: U32 family peptidase [Erysipelotrichaceae bacterium]|nr:U32 family peptidase [Erysipelotrichaceae bacterium]